MSLLVDMYDIHKSFQETKVLRGVQLQLKAGEVHALVGENGAGKSTLMKILGGIHKKDQGTVTINGKQVELTSPHDAIAAGIAIIHQELNLIPYLTVAENMFLGRELTMGRSSFLRSKEMSIKTREYLQRLGMDIPPDTITGSLSVGEQQMVEIAKALSMKAKALVMDEPTASLTGREIKALFQVMKELKEQGVGMIYISHRMEEIFEMSERITVLRDGQYIGTKETSETSLDDLVKMMVGRDIGERFPKQQRTLGQEMLRVEYLNREDELKDISFSVRAGEILGISGLMGAGRTELVRAIFGADPLDSGGIYINGQRAKIKNPSDAVKHGIALVTEDRKDQGLILGLSVRSNLTLANVKALSKLNIISTSQEQAFVSEKIEQLKIKTSSSEQPAGSLSGGNQQKIVIGKWLGIHPKVLILDEPTRGVDIGAKKEIYHIMNELTEQGVAVIMISSELPEILGMSDRIIVMHEGRIKGEFAQQDANQEKIMLAATGGE